MPWCPKCRSQYREDFTKCSDCNIDLVEKLEGDFNDEGISNNVLLITVNDEYEAQITASVLESNNIQYTKSNESEGFLQEDIETNNLGIDFYVSENDYEFAKKLLESRIDELVEDLENGEDNTDIEDDKLAEVGEEIEKFEDESDGNSKSNIILKLTACALVIIFVLLVYWYFR